MQTIARASKGVALITGGSRGIGRGIVLRLARDGFDIAVNDVPQNKDLLEGVVDEVKQLTPDTKAIYVVADVSKEEEVKGMIGKVVKELGGLDVLVANAAVCIGRSITDTTVDDWDRLFSVNARGTFLCYKYAALQMIEQGRGGRIIGSSSVAGKEGMENMSTYSATKFAIRGLTHAAAREWGRHGITVNVYCPGAIETVMTRALADDFGVPFEYLRKREEETAPIGRMGEPEDIANVVSFFAAKESGWLTGQSISPNGGRHVD